MSPKIATRMVDATPYAASLIEGYRDFGYNLETALADIIDNAITAGAVTLTENGVSPDALSDILQSNAFLRTHWDDALPILRDFLGARIS